MWKSQVSSWHREGQIHSFLMRQDLLTGGWGRTSPSPSSALDVCVNTLFRDVVPAIPLNIVPAGSQPSSLLSFLLTQWPGSPQLFIGSIPISVCFMRSGGHCCSFCLCRIQNCTWNSGHLINICGIYCYTCIKELRDGKRYDLLENLE